MKQLSGETFPLQHILNDIVFIFCLCVCLFRYYTFDDVFVREVLGKKLSKGTKKDLDDIGAKTGVTLKSCRRQVSAQCLCICITGLKMMSAHYHKNLHQL